ncbi:hypothetical protein B0A50_04595 [Salinomyces thailandicus]|uniref:Uncharacterized protein n=1 Tax=Salinomyces thailandicus TaxID=706561 RepID=A0A4V5N434_9PEZI|nr:hypothetical protein B0A50_04595 [Salinomyces thailandica]
MTDSTDGDAPEPTSVTRASDSSARDLDVIADVVAGDHAIASGATRATAAPSNAENTEKRQDAWTTEFDMLAALETANAAPPFPPPFPPALSPPTPDIPSAPSFDTPPPSPFFPAERRLKELFGVLTNPNADVVMIEILNYDFRPLQSWLASNLAPTRPVGPFVVMKATARKPTSAVPMSRREHFFKEGLNHLFLACYEHRGKFQGSFFVDWYSIGDSGPPVSYFSGSRQLEQRARDSCDRVRKDFQLPLDFDLAFAKEMGAVKVSEEARKTAFRRWMDERVVARFCRYAEDGGLEIRRAGAGVVLDETIPGWVAPWMAARGLV